MSCPLCNSTQLKTIHSLDNVPLFQNKVFEDAEESKAAPTGQVSLDQCENCNFIFNSSFNQDLMSYDENYQNEQANSNYFQSYLNKVIEIIKPYSNGKAIEIGCGKGHFLNLLKESGIDALGFDPAYEGNNPDIVKDYFSEKYRSIEADLIILRHTLEHVDKPLDFLHKIAKANDYKGKIYIEVPELEWIMKNLAFWDIFYEHCNYFSTETLTALFNKSENGLLFNEQYQYLVADLSELKKHNNINKKKTVDYPNISNHIEKTKKWLEDNAPVVVWGAGAKGATFSNIMGKDNSLIYCLVDINIKKQNKFTARSGHRILSPEIALSNNKTPKSVLVMNLNYEQEIKAQVDAIDKAISVYSLDKLFDGLKSV